MVIGLTVLVSISLQLINPQIRQLLDGAQNGRPQSALLTLAGWFWAGPLRQLIHTTGRW